MVWTKAMAMLLAVSVLAAPMPISVGTPAASGAASEFENYAAREAQAGDLEQFTGGWHGVVITLIVVAAVVYLVLWIWDNEHHDHPPAPPPEQPRP